MLRNLTRYVSTTSESSDDDRSSPKRQIIRMPVSDVQVRQFSENQPFTSTGGNSIANKRKTSPYLTRLRSRIAPAPLTSDKSSSSETDDSFPHARSKPLRDSSDYDTDTRSNEANNANPERILKTDDSFPHARSKPLRDSSDYDTDTRSNEANNANPERILNSLSLGSNNIQNNAEFDSSDDSSTIQTRSLKRRKSSVINLVSSTDSSDSGVPNQVVRAFGKRTRLCTSSESSTSTSDNSDETNENALDTYVGSQSVSNSLINTDQSCIRTPTSERLRRVQRLNFSRQNQIPALRESRPSSSRQNTIASTNNDRLVRSTRQARRRSSSNETGLGSNRHQLQNNRATTRTTSATSQNRDLNSSHLNNRRSSFRAQNNITMRLPSLRQSVRHNTLNSQNPSTVSGSNRQRDIRVNASRQNNTRSIENRQNNVRPLVTRGRQNNRMPTNRATGRTSTNSTSGLRRQNVTFTEPSVPSESDPETGFSLRISIRNGRNIRNVSSPRVQVNSRRLIDSGSSSGSSTDDMRPVVHRRRIILSSDNNTTSSDSETSSFFTQRYRRGVQMIISDSESAEETPAKPVTTSKKLNETILSDSDGETEKCPICFGRFNQQELGTPKTCEHLFCLDCIRKWAENNNTCPVDRRIFNSIVVRASVQGAVIREVPVKPSNIVPVYSDDSVLVSFSDSDSDTTDDLAFLGSDSDFEAFHGLDFDRNDYDESEEIVCNMCLEPFENDADDALTCDACDNSFHLLCVDPPLQSLPIDWICPECL